MKKDTTELVTQNASVRDLNPTGVRELAQVQAQISIAKTFPRDIQRATANILELCKQEVLAEEALYAYPRAGQTVTGPSIKLMQAIAAAWGNIESGIREISNENGVSEVECFAWDMETNTRDARTFRVKHERKTKNAVKVLDDPRDVYENTASQGQRRKRACLEAVIPSYITEMAVQEVKKTRSGQKKEPLKTRITKLVSAFTEFGVDIDMIEDRMEVKIDKLAEKQFDELREIYIGIRDGQQTREQWFNVPKGKAENTEKAENLTSEFTSQ